jgi:16S rRNA (uracil1498-N3)-methyltransferase
MRNPRIFTAHTLIPGATLALDERASHYLARVLRCQVGQPLTLFNGDGRDYAASITAADKRAVTVVINDAFAVECESPLQIHLGIAISKGERMDLVMQKAVELGVSAITPLTSERVEVRLQGERADKRLEHWQGIVVSACEQCGRSRIPPLHSIGSLHDWIASVEADRKFVLHHRSEASLGSMEKPRSVALLIGPEGGLSEAEIAAAEHAGFASLRLGPRVLRTETAPLAALSVLQYAFGDLNA